MHVAQPSYVMFSSQEEGRASLCDMRTTTIIEPCVLNRSALDDSTYLVGDTLVFAFHAREARSVKVVGGLEVELTRHEGSDVWGASLLVPRASSSIISYRFVADDSDIIGTRAEIRGADAPAPLLRSKVLHGTIRVDTLTDSFIGQREIITYVPAGSTPAKGYDVVYVADGQYVREVAAMVDTLVAGGHMKPTLLVGVRAARGEDRANEYIYGFAADSSRFLAHEKFFTETVAHWAEQTLHASTSRSAKLLWGTSNGGAFVVAMGLRHPELYSHIIAGSPVYDKIPRPLKGALPEFFITAGSFEETTRSRAKVLDDELKKYGAVTRFMPIVGGHDEVIWGEWFIRGMNAR